MIESILVMLNNALLHGEHLLWTSSLVMIILSLPTIIYLKLIGDDLSGFGLYGMILNKILEVRL